MTTDGGGWTLVMRARPGDNAHSDAAAVATLTAPTQSLPAKLSDAAINALRAASGGYATSHLRLLSRTRLECVSP